MKKILEPLKSHLFLIIFICGYLVYLSTSYTKFATTWDESFVYERGRQLYQHLFIPKHNESASLILRSSQNDVGPTYNNSYAAALYAFNKDESYEIYHLLNLLFSLLIFVFSYFFLFHKYKKPLLSLFGPLFIVLNPRFFGDIAANPKDVPFAVLYFISIATIYLLPSIKNILLHVLILGFLFAFTQSSWIIGYTLYPILFLYDLYRWHYKMRDYSKGNSSFLDFICQESLYIGSVFIVSNSFMVATWPYIGSNYFKNFINVLTTSGSFPWQGNIFFMGKEYFGLNLPLTYLPIWLLISQPIFITISSLGTLLILRKSWKENELLFLSLLPIGINLFLYFVLKPTVYDGVRHYLFLFPFFSVLAAIFIIELIKTKLNLVKYIFIISVVTNIILVIVSQVKLFPYQYVYFNELVGGLNGGAKNFETDYWNASFKESIAWLKKNKFVQNRKYSIYPCSYFSGMDQYLSENINYVKDYAIADYAICFTRFQEHNKLKGRIIHTVTRDSTPLNYVIENTR